MQSTYKLQPLLFDNLATYIVSSLFVVGNIVLPALFHLIPGGGPVWLPIYFFTLIGAYLFGWRVGILTSILSPIVNSLLFGMPVFSFLPVIIFKSILLAIFASFAAKKVQKVSVLTLAVIVVAYQFVGAIGEWLYLGNPVTAFEHLHIALPGMLLQIVAGWFVIKSILK